MYTFLLCKRCVNTLVGSVVLFKTSIALTNLNETGETRILLRNCTVICNDLLASLGNFCKRDCDMFAVTEI